MATRKIAKPATPHSSGTRKTTSAPHLTIYDVDEYFDAKFTSDELQELDEHILAECGFANDFHGRAWLFCEKIKLRRELEAKLGLRGGVPGEWITIHMCRELEIDYKSFAKNTPKLPIEPFYRFIESRFPQFKPTNNKLRLDVQKCHLRAAYIDWVELECRRTACPKSYHGSGCEDRYEEPDYLTAVQRVWRRNAARLKLTLVHSA